MRIIDERRVQTTAISQAQSLYPDTHGRAQPIAARPGPVWKLLSFLRSIIAQIGASRQRRATVKLLSELSDYELADIGIHRGQLYSLFEPGFMDATDIRQRADDDLQEHIMADLGLSYRLPRPPPIQRA